MQKKRGEHIITIVLLALLLLPSVANLHAFEHVFEDNDDPISCDVCDIIAHSNQLEHFGGEANSYDSTRVVIPTTAVIVSTFEIPLEKIFSPTSIYNKPPPTF